MTNPWVILGAVFLVIGLMAGSYHKGSKNGAAGVQVKWDTEKQKQQVDEKNAILARQKENEKIQKENDDNNRQVASDYENRLVLLRAGSSVDRAAIDAAGGLRDPGAACNPASVPAEATGYGQHDESVTGGGKLSKEAEDFLWSEADRADDAIEKIRESQEWAKKNGFYGP